MWSKALKEELSQIRKKKNSCSHKDFWIIDNGNYLWCPDCGGLRRCKVNNKASITPIWRRWLIPKGQTKVTKLWEKMRDERNSKFGILS